MLLKIIELYQKLLERNKILADLLKNFFKIIQIDSPNTKEETNFIRKNEFYHKYSIRNKFCVYIYDNLINLFGYDENCGIILNEEYLVTYHNELEDTKTKNYIRNIRNELSEIIPGLEPDFPKYDSKND